MSFDFKNATKEQLQLKYNEVARVLGDDQFFTKKELHHLPEVLQDGEQILGFSSGLMDGNTWLITLTDKRILFLDKGMIFGLKQVSIPLNKINSVSGETGILFGTISITDGAVTRKITNVWKKTVKTFTNLVQIEVDKFNNTTKPSSNRDNKYDQLEKLAALKEKGVISEAEFNQEKKKLLG